MTDNTLLNKAWIVFTDQNDLPALGFLRRGYRHCFIVFRDAQGWVSIDPMAHCTEVRKFAGPASFDMPKYLKNRGYHVIEASLEDTPKKVAPVMFFTCVEACKRFLGIHAFFVLTPWQLCRYLLRNGYAFL